MVTTHHNSAGVLVVGGGIIGTLTALALAKRGASVAVLERGEPLRESSWAGAGILSPIYPWKYPDALSHLVNRSLALYPELVAELQSVSGVDPQHRRTGLIIPIYDEHEWHTLSGAETWSARFGWQINRLTGAEARAVEPCLAEGVLGALDWPDVGQIRNPRLAAAARATAEAKGVVFHSNCEVTHIDPQGAAGVSVTTVAGTFHGGKVLLSAGSWTGDLAVSLGLSLPVKPVKGQILLLKTAPGTLTRIVKHEAAYLVPRADGRILVGATMEMTGFDRRTTLSAMHFLSGALLDMTPSLADAEVERHWMGFRPGTPDGLPYLGPVPGHDTVYVATGHYRNGVVLAPATAEVMAAQLLGDTPTCDLSAFALDRPGMADNELGFPDEVAQAAGG